RKDRIGKGAYRRRRADLADAAHLGRILQYRDLECRALMHAHSVEIVEIRLHDPAFGEIDLLAHGGREAENSSGDELGLDIARIERQADIGGDPDFLQTDAGIRLGDLDHLRHPASEACREGEALRSAIGEWRTPAGHGRDLLDHFHGGWPFLHQPQAKLDRIDAAGMGDLVHEVFVEIAVYRIADRPPEANRHRQVGLDGRDAVIRDRIRLVERAIHHGLVWSY